MRTRRYGANVFACLIVGVAPGYAQVCSRNPSPDDSIPGTFYAAAYESQYQRQRDGEYRFVYCVRNTNEIGGAPIIFDWKNGIGGSYFDSVVPAGIELGQSIESRCVNDTSPRTITFNYVKSEPRDTIHNYCDIAALSEYPALDARASLIIASNSEVYKTVAGGEYSFDEKDFVEITVFVTSSYDSDKIMNSVFVEANFDENLLESQLALLEEHPKYVVGESGAFRTDVYLPIIPFEKSEALDYFPIGSSSNLQVRTGQLHVVDETGFEYGLMTFEYYSSVE